MIEVLSYVSVRLEIICIWKNLHRGEQCLPGMTYRVNGLVSYVVKFSDGQELKLYVDHFLYHLDGKEIELTPTPVA